MFYKNPVLDNFSPFATDTERFYTDVQEKILASYGKTFEWSLKAKMMGKKAVEAGQIFVNETGLTGILTPEEFISQREVMLHSLFPESELLPGEISFSKILQLGDMLRRGLH